MIINTDEDVSYERRVYCSYDNSFNGNVRSCLVFNLVRQKKRKVVFIPLITTNVRETILIKSGPVNRLEMVAKFQSLLRDFSLIKL